MALGPLNLDIQSIPSVKVSDLLPDLVQSQRRTPIIPNQPRAVTSLEGKYGADGYFNTLAASGAYAPEAINALRSYDESRVQRGQAPLTESQTQAALQAATTKDPVTELPQRSIAPWNIPGNAVKDFGNILRSLPQLPSALFNEVKSLPEIPEYIAKAENPIAGIAGAPGIRMLPGAFIAENIAKGEPANLLRNPLFTALDILPAAQGLAKGTKVVRAVEDLATIGRTTDTLDVAKVLANQRLAERPISTALTRKLTPEGDIVRSTAGELTQMMRGSPMGQKLDSWFGQPSRDAIFFANSAKQRVAGIMGGKIDAPDNALAPLAREAVQFQDKLTELGFTTTDQIADLTNRAREGRYTDATPQTLEALELVRDWNGRVAETLNTKQLAVMFDNELYDLPTGIRLKEKERAVKRVEEQVNQRGRIESSMIDPTTVNASQVAQEMGDLFRKPRREAANPDVALTADQRIGRLGQASMTEIRRAHNATVRQLRNAGYDTTELQRAWAAVEGNSGKRNKKGVLKGRVEKNPDLYRYKLEEIAKNPDVLPKLDMLSVDEAIAKLQTYARDVKAGEGVRNITFGIKNGDLKSITQGLEQLRRTPLWEDQALINRIREMRDTKRFIDNSYKGVSEKSLAKSRKEFGDLTREAVPARFLPELQRQTRIGARQQALDINTVDEAAEVNRMADMGLWSGIPNFTEKMYRSVQRDAARQWKTWRDEGFDPVYVHTVTPNKALSAVNPYATIVPKTASSIKKRAWDIAPGINNVGLAMTNQMMELLSREQVEISIKQIIDQMGESEYALHERFGPAAQQRAATNASLDFDGHLQNIIKERYTKFDPDLEGYAWGSPYLNQLKKDGMYIPTPVAKTLKDLAEPKRLLGGALDPITNTFRIATTSLSVRTQLYNVVGNAVAAEVKNPGAVLRSGRKAMEWMRNPDLVPAPLREVTGQQAAFYKELDKEALGVIHEGAWGYLRGKTLGRMLKEDQATARIPGAAAKRYGEKFTGLVDKSYDLNGKVDDFYRMVNYIDNYDRAVKKGSTVADAERRAISSVRKNQQDWMSMTPVERGVIRAIFPFYGYMGHALRFVLRYPFDHPLRTEVMSKLAAVELEDQDHLPSRFMSMLFVGGTGPEGERNAINAGPFNPFGDVSNYMTIQGLMGATNPAISTVLEMAGITDGQAELYPNLRYDSTTGRMTAKGTNPLTALLHNTIPQASFITAMLGVNEQYNDQVRRDPAGAMRYLASGLTLPIAWRKIKVNEEVMKAEMARIAVQDKVKAEALKSGNWQEALQYPSLRAYLEMVDNLPEETRAPFLQLTDEQISAITQADTQKPGTQLPQFAGVQPLDQTIESLMSQGPGGLLAASRTGRVLPNSSLTNTTGGI